MNMDTSIDSDRGGFLLNDAQSVSGKKKDFKRARNIVPIMIG